MHAKTLRTKASRTKASRIKNSRVATVALAAVAALGLAASAEANPLPLFPFIMQPAPAMQAPPPASPQAADEAVPAAGADVAAGLRHYLQLGAFASRENAEDFRSMAAGEIGEPLERLEVVPQGLRFRLHLGPYDTVEEARERAEAVGAALKLKPFVVAR